ncbi:MAG: alginate export family protein, partial [Paracoccaceae bacterium]|nr:alginate export family protein [Paracoccaceae bacterium]
FGAASALYSVSRGQDIFTDADRDFLHPDKGYVGLLYADPDTGNTAQLSFGRQTWTLNTGFLISMISGSSNAGERGATYLGPRNTTDFSALFNGEVGRARFAAFYVDPDEIEDLESNTTFAGLNLGWQFTDAFTMDASLITIPTSDGAYRTPSGEALAREGTTTWGARALWRPATPDHAWIEGEAYHQTNDAYAMAANAWYGTVGYIARSHPWSPSLSYRYASFSGDDPDTDTFERFDGLMTNGFGNWLQGMAFGKVYRNANLDTHRIQANVAPREGMNLTFEWHRLRAGELNNLGANPALSQLTSRDIGNEYTATLRWGIDRNRFLQVVASRALPGRALRDIGADAPWSTVQASLYVSF